MRPIDLSKLRAFYMVAREGNMTRAAEKMNMSQPSLSEAVSALEFNLKTQLFERLPRGMRLTAQGERVYAYAAQIMELTDSFEKHFHEKEDEIAGEIKIITTPFVGSEWLVPHLKGFLKKHPNITFQIVLKSDNIELFGGDVAITFAWPAQPYLTQKHLLDTQTGFYASSEYLKEFGTPQTIKDLDHHRLITYRGNYDSAYGSTNWILNIGRSSFTVPRKSFFEIDSLHGMFNAARQGLGIVELPNLDVIVNSGLQQILRDEAVKETALYFIYSARRKTSKKINLLYQYLSRKGK